MELKPCPFCGGKAKIDQTGCEVMATNRNSVSFDFTVRCRKCGATTPKAYGYIAVNLGYGGNLNPWHDDRPRAIEAWNRRADNE